MSDPGYDEDFEDYDEDFETDNELEVPEPREQDQQQQQHLEEQHSDRSTPAWPALQKPHHAAAATFTRSLISAGPPAAGQLPTGGVLVTVSPAPPPLTDSQRRHASKQLARSLLLKQQRRLTLGPQLQLLAMQPLSAAQQAARGVGAFAHARAAASQTRQLHQDIQEQDCQTAEVETQDGSCQVPDDSFGAAGSRAGRFPAKADTKSSGSMTGKAAAAAARQAAADAAAMKLLESDADMIDFVEWAVPEMLLELSKAAAAAAALQGNTAAAAAQQGLPFRSCTLPPPAAAFKAAGKAAGTASSQGGAVLVGEMQMGNSSSSLLQGRTVIALACPDSPATAAAAAAAIESASAAAAAGCRGGVSCGRLLLSCCGQVSMTAEASLREHGLPGLGCLCVWDLCAAGQQQQQQQQQEGQGPAGLLQLLVCEGQPTCCCWGTGGGSCLVFAGTEQGGLCCWDLSEPDSQHTWQQQQQQEQQQAVIPAAGMQRQQQQPVLPPRRRPCYTSEGPLLAALAAGGSSSSRATAADLAGDPLVAVAVLPASSGGSSSAAGAGVVAASTGAVVQLVSLTAGGAVAMHSVMWAPAGAGGGGGRGQGAVAGGLLAAAAATDLGMRSGGRVWLVKTFASLPLGLDTARPLHQRLLRQQQQQAGSCPAAAASALLLLPGPSQQLLVGTAGGRVLRGACLGVPPAPREFVAEPWGGLAGAASCLQPADTDNAADATPRCRGNRGVMGAVVGLSLGQQQQQGPGRLLWLAGCSCGSVALFSSSRSRPLLLWQQVTGGPPVLAVRWVPGRSAAFLVLDAAGGLLLFDLAVDTQQPAAAASLVRPAVAAGGAAAALPSCLEVCVISGRHTTLGSSGGSSALGRDIRQHSSSSGGRRGLGAALDRAAAGPGAEPERVVAVAVGYSDGAMWLYRLSPALCASQDSADEAVLTQIEGVV